MFIQIFLMKWLRGKQIKTLFKHIFEKSSIWAANNLFLATQLREENWGLTGTWLTNITRYYQGVLTFRQRLLQSASFKAPCTLVNISEIVSLVTRETSKRVQMDQCASIHTNGETSKYPSLRGRQLCHPFLIERPTEFYSPRRKRAAIECWT